jgi:hypothetical protein
MYDKYVPSKSDILIMVNVNGIFAARRLYRVANNLQLLNVVREKEWMILLRMIYYY